MGLRREDGFAMASVIAILAIVLIVTAVGAKIAISSVNESGRDRAATQAFAAAESALDITNWRMNRLLVSNEVGTLLSLSGGPQATGCVVEAGGQLGVVPSAEASCEIDIGGLSDGAEARCKTTVALNLSTAGVLEDASATPGDKVLFRPVTCTATVNKQTRRVYARLGLRVKLNAAGTAVAAPSSLWRRYAWVECPSDESVSCP